MRYSNTFVTIGAALVIAAMGIAGFIDETMMILLTFTLIGTSGMAGSRCRLRRA